MSTPKPISIKPFLKQDMTAVFTVAVAGGEAAVFTSRAPDKQSDNEDAAAIIPFSETNGVLIVADGFGGHPSGDEAAALSIDALTRSISECSGADQLRAAIVDGFESANEAVLALGVGAATTLSVVEIANGVGRAYHVGDSDIVVVGQRGKLKFRTVSHSPIGYAVESGLMDDEEAIHHEERHIVSNMVGSDEMRIEIGSARKLSPRDTVLLASDGLYDNILFEDIVERIRKGPLPLSVAYLASLSRDRMATPRSEHPSKPDDLTIVAFRPGAMKIR